MAPGAEPPGTGSAPELPDETPTAPETPPPSGRLLGLETEYAIRYAGTGERPRHDYIFESMVGALHGIIEVYRGDRRFANQQVFVGNGGAFYYEFQPTHRADGLIEGSTPECRSAAQLVLYQRAQEELLKRALLRIRPQMARGGFRGQVALLKNARDAEGHGYGTHENYEVDAARGIRLMVLRLGLIALLPLVLVINVMVWLIALVMIGTILIGLLFGAIAALVVTRWRPALARWVDFEARDAPMEQIAGLVSLRVTQVIQVPLDLSFGLLYGACFFYPHRRALTAFFASRVIVSGSGCLMDDGVFWLSERGATLTGVRRWMGAGTTHVVFDSGNLLKGLWSLQFLKVGPLRGLFRRRQRMQIAYSDSNRCQLAEFLKVGTTLLILDMVDAGWLSDAPQLTNPYDALRTLARDPRAKVRLRKSEPLDAFELQQWYLAQAERYIETEAVTEETRRIVKLWRGVLDALDLDPSSLVGRIDWITKKYLMDASGLDEFAARKKIDLRYSELETGYFDRLVDRGLTLELFEPEAVRVATMEPPRHSPAELRAEILAELPDTSEKVRVTWDHIRVGSWWGGRVIRLEDFRKKSDLN